MNLSDLSRAALAERERYGWMHLTAFAYCVVIGAFSAGAWMQQGEYLRSAICGGAQVLSVIMALACRRGITGQMPWAAMGCGAIAFGFSTWAAAGLTHAWTANGMAIQTWQVYFLTASEPAIFLLIEHIKEGRETLRAAHAKRQADEEEELRRIRQRQDKEDAERRKLLPAPLPKNVTRLKPRQRIAKAAAIAGAVAVGQAAAVVPAMATDAPMVDTTKTAPAHAGDNARVAEACRLRDSGMTQAEVAKAMGCSTRSVSRYWSIANRAGAIAA